MKVATEVFDTFCLSSFRRHEIGAAERPASPERDRNERKLPPILNKRISTYPGRGKLAGEQKGRYLFISPPLDKLHIPSRPA